MCWEGKLVRLKLNKTDAQSKAVSPLPCYLPSRDWSPGTSTKVKFQPLQIMHFGQWSIGGFLVVKPPTVRQTLGYSVPIPTNPAPGGQQTPPRHPHLPGHRDKSSGSLDILHALAVALCMSWPLGAPESSFRVAGSAARTDQKLWKHLGRVQGLHNLYYSTFVLQLNINDTFPQLWNMQIVAYSIFRYFFFFYYIK